MSGDKEKKDIQRMEEFLTGDDSGTVFSQLLKETFEDLFMKDMGLTQIKKEEE